MLSSSGSSVEFTGDSVLVWGTPSSVSRIEIDVSPRAAASVNAFICSAVKAMVVPSDTATIPAPVSFISARTIVGADDKFATSCMLLLSSTASSMFM